LKIPSWSSSDKAASEEVDDKRDLVYQLLREEGCSSDSPPALILPVQCDSQTSGGRGATIVTILCDSGRKYQSELFNPAWLKEHDLDPNPSVEAIFD